MEDDISNFLKGFERLYMTTESERQFVQTVSRIIGGAHKNIAVEWPTPDGRIFQFSLEDGLRSHYSGWGGDRGRVSQSHPLWVGIKEEIERNHLHQDAQHNMLMNVVAEGGWYWIGGQVAIEIREGELTGGYTDPYGCLAFSKSVDGPMENIHLVLMAFRRLREKLPPGAGKLEVMTASREAVAGVFGDADFDIQG